MKLLFGDFETFYSSEYTLRTMTPVEYILDPRWEMIGCAVRGDGEDDWAKFLEDDDFKQYLTAFPPEHTAFVSHNALFDACILAWRYNYYPKLYIDTMGMARALLNHKIGSVSLDKVQQHLGLGEKLTALAKVQGMNGQAIKDNRMWAEFATYAKDDCEKMRQIFHRLKPDFPMSEYLVKDSVIRCAVMPKFTLDTATLYDHLNVVQVNKATLLAATGMQNRFDLMSDAKFALALQACGIVPPTKISLKTGKEKWAFAKTDDAMAALLDHPDDRVQALVAARFGFKTTLEESRTERMINISQLGWPNMCRAYKRVGWTNSWMPMPLRYSGAHTHRLSGDWKINVQNFPRGGNLRKALVTPQGYKVIAADMSQIEARLTAWFCEQEDLRKAFEDGEDIYSSFAAEEIYHRPVNRQDNPRERFIGKQAILGAGFGAGGKKFNAMVATLSRLQLNETIELGEEEGKRIITSYRKRYSSIAAMWNKLLGILPDIARGDEGVFGPDGVIRYGQDHIRLPNGLCLFYDDVRYEGEGWTFTYAKRAKFLHGGKLLENIIQALARIIIMDAAMRMRQRHGLHFALQVHDELVYVEPEEIAEKVLSWLMEEMVVRPKWGLTIPLAAEGAIGDSYGDVK